MKQFLLDQAHQSFMDAWAKRNGWKIVSCSSPDSEFTRQYAANQRALCVADPRAGRPGCVVVVKALQ